MIKYLLRAEKTVCSLLGFFKDQNRSLEPELSQFGANNLADVWPSANPDLNSRKYMAGAGEYYCFSIARLNCKSSEVLVTVAIMYRDDLMRIVIGLIIV